MCEIVGFFHFDIGSVGFGVFGDRDERISGWNIVEFFRIGEPFRGFDSKVHFQVLIFDRGVGRGGVELEAIAEIGASGRMRSHPRLRYARISGHQEGASSRHRSRTPVGAPGSDAVREAHFY